MKRISCRISASVALLAIISLFCLCCGDVRAARDHNFQGVNESRSDPVPLLPFLDYLLDDGASMDIDEAASPARAQLYKPLVLDDLPLTEGVMWLRFTISALAPSARPATFLLDMGQGAPGLPLLYTPEKNELSGALEWQENIPAQRNIFLLPEAGPEPITCYIRLDGLPGVWFSPMIRTPQNAASNWGSLARTGAALALAVIMVFCLLRGFGEKGQWRIWTAFYVAVALAQALLGMPPISGKAGVFALAATLTPGIALMLLPHIGRHLTRSRETSRAIDWQLFILSFPGAILALLPLVPGWNWLDRWLDLWPLCAVIFLPTALAAWIMGLRGSRRFLLGCLIPPLFTGAALTGLFFGFPAYLLSSGPLWGVALSAIVLASVSAQWDTARKQTAKKPAPAAESDGEDLVLLEHPLDDPNLRIVSPNYAADTGETETKSEPAPAASEAAVTSDVCEKLEKEMREPIDILLREGVALGQCSLPPAARDHAEKMIQCAKTLTEILVSGPVYSLPRKNAQKRANFNLQKLLREVSDSISSLAENSGVALSWRMPPFLEQWFYGDAESLRDVLALLMESSIRASARGGVKLSVKRAPDSSDPYYLQFTVADNGSGVPPFDRSSLALVKAWELAGRTNGYLEVDAGKHGATVTFSMRFEKAIEEDEPEAEEGSLHIIVASDDETARGEIVRILERLPCRVSEASNAREALIRQSMDPAPLLIAQGKMASPAAADMAQEFAALAKKAGFARGFILAITPDTSQWNLLKPSGFTHAMTEPIDAETLIETVKNFSKTLVTAKDESPVGSIAEELKPRPENESPSSDETRRDDKDFAPSMIVDQSLDINYNFDTPKWLENDAPNRGADDELTGGSTAGERETETDTRRETADAGTEWVGEPTPIIKPVNDAEKDAADAKNLESTATADGSAPISGVKPDAAEATENAARETVPETNAATVAPAPDAGEPPSPKKSAEDTRSTRDKESELIDPVVTELIAGLQADMREALVAFAREDGPQVAVCTEKIAKKADAFGFRHLARLAQCVQRAASVPDMAALNDLLPDLTQAVERYCIHLTQQSR